MQLANHQQIDARQLVLDADFETLSVPDAKMIELARQWAAQVGTWLGVSNGREVFRP